MVSPPRAEPTLIGRYVVFEPIASGGVATVHLGRMVGSHGFERVVAIKRLHAHLTEDPGFVAALIDEARIASHITHPNVASILDVVEEADHGVCLVMDYVEGASLGALVRASLRRTGAPPAAAIVAAVLVGALRGLHAAHEASRGGVTLGVVHRDVSPQNIVVSKDGVARVVDFGVAKALGRLAATTQHGQIKGKLPYMAPEQLRPGGVVTRRTDVYGAGVVLWEALTATRLFTSDEVAAGLLHRLDVRAPSAVEPSVPSALDEVTLRALAVEPAARFATAEEMARSLEAAIPIASPRQIEQWVHAMAADELAAHAARIAAAEVAHLPPDAEATSVARPARVETPSPLGRRRRKIAVAALLLVGAAVPAALLLAWSAGRAPSSARESSAALPDPSTAPSAALGLGADATPTPPATSGAASSAAATSPRAPSAGRPAAPPARASAATRACSPPYHVERGIKIFKPECLR